MMNFRTVEGVKSIKFHEHDIPNLELRGYVCNSYRPEVVEKVVIEEAPHQVTVSFKGVEQQDSEIQTYRVWVPWNYYLVYTESFAPYKVMCRGKQRVRETDKFVHAHYMNTRFGGMCYGRSVETEVVPNASLRPEVNMARYLGYWWQAVANNDYSMVHPFWDYMIEKMPNKDIYELMNTPHHQYLGAKYFSKNIGAIKACLSEWEKLSLAEVLSIFDTLCKERGSGVVGTETGTVKWLPRRRGSLNSKVTNAA